LRDQHEEFTKRDVRLVVIGMGATETAHRFKNDYRLPFTVLVDKKRESYRLLGLKRGSISELMGPRVWAKGIKNIVRHGQGIPKEDPYQLGGAALVENRKVKFVHRASTSADNLPVDKLLAHV